MVSYGGAINFFHNLVGMGKWKRDVKAVALERRFIREIKRLGKVASVHSIRPLLVFDNNNIQNLICYFRFGAGRACLFLLFLLCR